MRVQLLERDRPAATGVENSITKHVLPVLGAHPLASLRRSDVEALCASLRLAPSTVAVVHQHLGQLLASAVEDGLIPKNPAAKARLPKREASKAQPVPLQVVERIQAALPEWLAVAVPLGVGVGLRQGEASGLAVDRVDFLRRTLRVDQQLICRHVPAPALAPPKTASSHRIIPLATFVLDDLADHLRRIPPDRASWCCAPPPACRSMPTASATSGAERADRLACPASGTTPCATPSPRRCCPVACR